MIILNGKYFDTISLSEKPAFEVYSSYKRSTVGKIVMTQQQVASNERAYTLNVDIDQRLRLEYLAMTLGPMDFVDDTGFSWLTASGTDSSTIAYSTGAYFKPHVRFSYQPQSGKDGRVCDMNWNVDIVLLVNATGVRSGSANPMELSALTAEVPAGTVNGINDTFTLTAIPTSILLFVEGLLQQETVDYTISGQTITFAPGSIPLTGNTIVAYYTT